MSKATHTPGPWVDGRTADSIVRKNYSPPDSLAGSLFEFYGGLPIAESVAANNKPLIKAAPDLLAVAEKTDELIQMFVGINSPDEPYLVYSLPREVQDMIFELTAITHAAIATAKGK